MKDQESQQVHAAEKPRFSWRIGQIGLTGTYAFVTFPIVAAVITHGLPSMNYFFLIMPCLFAASAIQTVGYLFVSKRIGLKTSFVCMTGFSLSIHQPTYELHTYRERFWIALGGPVASLFAFLILCGLFEFVEILFPNLITNETYRDINGKIFLFAFFQSITFLFSFFPVGFGNGMRVWTLLILANSRTREQGEFWNKVILRGLSGVCVLASLFVNLELTFTAFCVFLIIFLVTSQNYIKQYTDSML